MTTTVEDVVILVPGFLGFANVGGFYYFADRVSTTLRAALQERTGHTIPVVPLCTMPTASLVHRQTKLVDSLKQLLALGSSITRLHLVGHSAGGVDAHLLTCARPLGRATWTAAAQQVREKIASVVTIASPHHGTVMADSAEVLLRGVQGFLSTTRMLWHLKNVVWRDGETVEAMAAVLTSMTKSTGFLWQIATNHDLIRDLRTASMARIRESQGESSVPLLSFVTLAPPPGEGSDPFFADLYRFAARMGDRATEAVVQENLGLIKRNLEHAIRESTVQVPEITALASDGIVNSVRQLVAARSETFGGVVVADHADVMGHYDRLNDPVSQQVVNSGLFHSGARFRCEQFFSLYGQVAKFIHRQISAARSQTAA